MTKMARGEIQSIRISRTRRGPMESVQEVMALEGRGLEGDRYATAEGSYSEGLIGKRQVTLMHVRAFDGQSIYTFAHSRRGLLVEGDDIELIWLFAKGHEFDVGDARLKPIGYCDPCHVPTKYARKSREQSFRKLFWERGGIIANVIRGGSIWEGCPVIAPHKGR